MFHLLEDFLKQWYSIDNHVWEEESRGEKPAFWGVSFWRVVECIDVSRTCQKESL